ncbi:ROK family glucokinase [Gracilibacillus caseinilyticus]|uniref:Glucokinase n=1 Tax=Gracilibacillus caseinilyticus TaxID=2932256 RepID=A0ABY4ESQ2_9BACI|nr:ROK family glucokinase [Gracilibacillus caseinilyticus]UOQ47454.1 ROK family glucokinase [Gracilibacillus caseinilyticus]
MEKDLMIGIDIGGTTVKHAIITSNGEMVSSWEIPTNLQNAGISIPTEIWASIDLKLKELDITKQQILGIGVGAPGFIEPETGIVAIAVNIGWKDFRLKDLLEDLSGLPVLVDNDANIAALGENWQGSGDQVDNMLAVTLGTGVGGGIIANGHILSGANGTGAEIGHMIVEPDGAPCNCGRNGCLETVTSATGIVRQAEELMDEGKAVKLQQRKARLSSITTKEIFECASEGDPDCQALLQYVFDVLGFSLANVAATVNPAKILIGGGVSKAGDALLKPVKAAFEKYALARANEACTFGIAELGNNAGVYGGAYLVLQNN